LVTAAEAVVEAEEAEMEDVDAEVAVMAAEVSCCLCQKKNMLDWCCLTQRFAC
jgi:hypothetical protein